MTGLKRCCIGCSLLVVLSSCRLVRDTVQVENGLDGIVNEIHPGKIVLTSGLSNVNVDALIELFLGMSEEDAAKYHDPFAEEDELDFETEKYSLSIGVGTSVFVSFTNEYEAACSAYGAPVYTRYIECRESDVMMKMAFPAEQIENCTKEEAIEFCYPYAEVLGYADADVEVYAVTLEVLQSMTERLQSGGVKVTAPIPGYIRTLMTKEEVEEARENGEEEALWQLGLQYSEEIAQYSIPWAEKDEAYILVYNKMHEGIPVESMMDVLEIIYTPQYEKPVYLQGSFPMEEISSTIPEKNVTSYEAIVKVMTYEGIDSIENIEIKSVEAVYKSEVLADEQFGFIKKLIPYWKIEYQVKGRVEHTDENVKIRWVDAIYGEVAQ